MASKAAKRERRRQQLAAARRAANRRIPAKKPAKPGKPASAVPTPHLTPDQQSNYLQGWNDLVLKGIDATGTLRQVLDDDPNVRQEIADAYAHGTQGRGTELAQRGQSAHGVSNAMLYDVTRAHDLAVTRQADRVAQAQQFHDRTIQAIRDAQGGLKLGAVGMKLGNLYGDDYYATPGTEPTPGTGGGGAGGPAAPPAQAAPPDPHRTFTPNAWQRAALARIKPGPAGNAQRIGLLNLWTQQRTAADNSPVQRAAGQPYGPTGAPFRPGRSLGMYPGAPRNRGAIVAPGAITPHDVRQRKVDRLTRKIYNRRRARG